MATLSLAAGAVSSGTAGTGSHGAGFSAVLAGGALLVMATFVPFAILPHDPGGRGGRRVGHLDGLRSRGTAAVHAAAAQPRRATCSTRGCGHSATARLMAATPAAGAAATGGGRRRAGPRAVGPGAAGPGAATTATATATAASARHTIELGDGDPDSQRIYDESVARGIVPRPKGPKPILAPRSGAARGGADGNGDRTAPPVRRSGRPVGTGDP